MSYNEESELMDLLRRVPCSSKGRNRPGLLDALIRGEVSKTEGTERGKTLGVYCVEREDTLTFISSTGFLTQGLTTRSRMLSLTARIYDPLGYLAPFTVQAKVLL
ncbi:conserved hypothetical protein [Trichinella spiralis]|uniref:hypothetical protein n=1 Tax=Trichinella spiralis TaxID=6334 RepID=UPI0001EFB7BC|nr:conserved hypothetical protein [Trichinella spiralis]